jgi:NAD(P)H dehydrogenase (quinone)
MLWVGLGEMVVPDGVNRLSSYLGAMTQSGNVPPEQEPGQADQATGEALGKRVAKAAARWGNGVG